MKDVDGKRIGLGDVVYWREYEQSPYFHQSGEIVYVHRADRVYVVVLDKYGESRHKYPTNVRKMTKEEAVLWKLENS